MARTTYVLRSSIHGSHATRSEIVDGIVLSAAARVLVVDDDRAVRDLVALTLARAGCRVTTADGGAQALDLLAARPFDAVVLDVQMPGTDGWAVLRSLRGRADAPAAVVMSGHARPEDVLAAGGVALLRKPFTRAALLLALRDALGAGEEAGTAPGYAPLAA